MGKNCLIAVGAVLLVVGGIGYLSAGTKNRADAICEARKERIEALEAMNRELSRTLDRKEYELTGELELHSFYAKSLGSCEELLTERTLELLELKDDLHTQEGGLDP